MRKLFLASALVVLLLLAGCIQLPGKGGGEKTGTQAEGGKQQGGGEQQKTQQQTQEQEKEQEQAQNYDEMAMGALMKLGAPIKCTFTYRSAREGISGSAVYYILNKNIRMESQQTNPDGKVSTTVIMKNEEAYLQMTPEMKVGMYQNCDWLYYPKEEAKEYEINEEETVGATYKDLGYEYTYKCEPAMFGEERFATPGKVCNVKEMLGNMCATIEDPEARAQCEQAIAAQ
ncbi:MAG: hypothetical protein QXG02_01990 [Candidatus Anstonellales archaeon]